MSAAPLPRLPYILLIAMTIVSFGGPFAIVGMLRGGEIAGWPPDRAVEWATIAIVLTLFITLFVACVSIRLWFRPSGDGGSRRQSGWAGGDGDR